MIGGGREGHVRNVPEVVIRHAGAGLPGRPGERPAGAAAAGGGRPVGDAVVPHDLRDVGQRRREVRAVGGVPVLAAAFVEFRSAHAGHLGDASRHVHRQFDDVDRLVGSSQSAPPASPEAANQVMPCELACWAPYAT